MIRAKIIDALEQKKMAQVGFNSSRKYSSEIDSLEQDRKDRVEEEQQSKDFSDLSGGGVAEGSGSAREIARDIELFERWQEYNDFEGEDEEVESRKNWVVKFDEGQRIQEIRNTLNVLMDILSNDIQFSPSQEYLDLIEESFGESSELRGYLFTMSAEPKVANLMLSLVSFVSSIYQSSSEKIIHKLQIFPLSLTVQDFACIPGVRNRLEVASCGSIDDKHQIIIDAFETVIQNYYQDCYRFVYEGNNVHIKEAIKYVLGFEVEDDFAKVTSHEIPVDILYRFFVDFEKDFEKELSARASEMQAERRLQLIDFLISHPIQKFNDELGEYQFIDYGYPTLIHRLEDKLQVLEFLDIGSSLMPYHYPLWIEESKIDEGFYWKSLDYIIEEADRRNRGIYPKKSDEEEAGFDEGYSRDTGSSITLAPSISPRSEAVALDVDSSPDPSPFELSGIDFPNSIFHKDFPSTFANAILGGDIEVKKKAIKILSLISDLSFAGHSNKIIAETFLIIASRARIDRREVGAYLLSLITNSRDRLIIDEAAPILDNAQTLCDLYIAWVASNKSLTGIADDATNAIICNIVHNDRFGELVEIINSENVVEVLRGVLVELNFKFFIKHGVNNPNLDDLFCHIINVYPKEHLQDLRYPLSQIIFAKFRVGDLTFFEAVKDVIEYKGFLKDILVNAFSYGGDNQMLDNLLYLAPKSARDIFTIREGDESHKVLLNKEYVSYLAMNFINSDKPSAFANLVKNLFDDKMFSDVLMNLLEVENNAAVRLLMNSYQEALASELDEEDDKDSFQDLIRSLCRIMISDSSGFNVLVNPNSIFIIAANQENEDFLYKIYEVIGADNTASLLNEVIQSVSFSCYLDSALDKRKIFETAFKLARGIHEIEEDNFIEKLLITEYEELILNLAINEDSVELFTFMQDFDRDSLEYEDFVKIIEGQNSENVMKHLLFSYDTVNFESDDLEDGELSFIKALFRHCIEDENDCSSIKWTVKLLKDSYQENFDQEDLIKDLEDDKKAIVIKHVINHKLSEFIADEDGHNFLEEAREANRKDLLVEALKS